MQLKDVIVAAIINILWVIWSCRNKVRFDNKKASFQSAISIIYASISLSGNLSKKQLSSSIEELTIQNSFGVAGHSGRARLWCRLIGLLPLVVGLR